LGQPSSQNNKMATWYLAKVSITQQDEKGNAKPVKQSYLFDAVSYTDAEARVTEYVAPEFPEFILEGLTKMKLNEVFFVDNGAETWFKSKVQYIVYDEKSQKEKLVPFMFLINAKDIKECYGLLQEKCGTINDYIITDINVTKILDVIPYDDEDKPKKETSAPRNLVPLSEIENTVKPTAVYEMPDDDDAEIAEVAAPGLEEEDPEEED
jgi:hypothetical protein